MSKSMSYSTIKEEFSTIEVYGAQTLFNIAIEQQLGYDVTEEIFVSCGQLNSASDANGTPIEFDGSFFSHLYVQENGMLISVFIDGDDEETYYETTENGFTLIKGYCPNFKKEGK